MNEIDYAYLAGVMDADGSFCITKSPPPKRSKNPLYRGAVTLSQIDIDIVKIIADLVNTKIYIRKFNLKNRKDQYSIIIRGQKAKKFINLIFPYLILKRKQAGNILILIDMLKYTSRHGRYPTDEKDIKKREEIYLKNKLLNKREK